MTPFSENIDYRLWQLANADCDGTISEQELRELELLLDADPSAQEFYVDFLTINADILWLVSAKQRGTMISNAQASPAPLTAPPNSSPALGFLGGFVDFLNHHSPLSFVLLFAIFGATLLATTYLLSTRHSGKVSAELEFVAQITATKDCLWSTTMPSPPETMQLQVGRQLQFEKGLVQITYSNNAEVLLEGPVSFTVDSAKSGFLSRGKLTARADTQQSRQFAIVTPDARFVDLGTEFGVMIDDKGRAEVAVFAGKVNAEAKLADGRWNTPVALSAGEAVVCEGRKFTPQVALRSNFPTLRPLPPPPPDPSYLRWLDASRDLQTRQDLLAYYDFQPDPSNPKVLLNRAPSGAALNGEIQNATWCQGRFSDKSALEFKVKKAGVRINLPGEYRQMTLIAWVNCKRFANNYNCILFSDYWKQLKQLHWQIRKNGQFEFSVFGQKGGTYSDRTFPDDCLDRWCMVAGVIDTPSQSTLYLNGKIFERLTSEQIPAVQIGPAMIGGWNASDSSSPDDIRNLSGRLDELMIFQRALSAEEIKQIYETGKP